MCCRADRRRAGFTLIEILVVIAVIAVLAGVVAPMVFGHVSDAKATAARAQIEIFGLALDQFRLDSDDYPTTAQGLAALERRPDGAPQPRNWRGPYLKKRVPMDPWGRPYVYTYPVPDRPGTYDLRTLGRDGKPGGQGEDADVASDDLPASATGAPGVSPSADAALP
ncbi:MAG TPA: type II secretion system major pseudopilin GspG [Gemmatimonadales bacterium]|nr:type II secretion system major pseudopilin GspG [Gemmatimonadales bacterium]